MSLPLTAIAYTVPLTPSPSVDQPALSQRAMRLAGSPAAVRNAPPAYTLFPTIFTAYTVPPSPGAPKRPSQAVSWAITTTGDAQSASATRRVFIPNTPSAAGGGRGGCKRFYRQVGKQVPV